MGRRVWRMGLRVIVMGRFTWGILRIMLSISFTLVSTHLIVKPKPSPASYYMPRISTIQNRLFTAAHISSPSPYSDPLPPPPSFPTGTNATLAPSGNGTVSVFVRDPRIGWPDALTVAEDGYLYFTVNQLWRSPMFYPGTDRRVKPYVAFRVRCPDGGGKVLLR